MKAGSAQKLLDSRVRLLVVLGLSCALAPALPAGDAAMPEAALQKVKNATVYLRVTPGNGKIIQGSGFFAVEPGIVLTNAHVLGMLRPEGRRPAKVEIIVASGEKEERAHAADILGVDRISDLAVLRVTGKDLPKPLRVVSAGRLRETQPVFVFGFPLGTRLGKSISVSKSSVSSLRKNAQGIVNQLQIQGGMHPGNSGGPVVDAEANVVGVARAVVRDTQLHLAIPGDYVHVVLNGRITGLGCHRRLGRGHAEILPAPCRWSAGARRHPAERRT